MVSRMVWRYLLVTSLVLVLTFLVIQAFLYLADYEWVRWA